MLTIAVFLFLLKENTCYLVLPPTNGSLKDIQFALRRSINNGPVPEHFDWRDNNMVSPVKQQLNCTACWAFSSIASIESHRKIYKGVAEVLSEQFLIDCDDVNKGCGYGNLLQTFADIVTKFGGVLRDSEYYPYVARSMPCRWGRPKSDASQYGLLPFHSHRYPPHPRMPLPVDVVGFRRVYPNEDIMAEFLYTYGPLSAGINSASMDKYSGGIDEPTNIDCDPKRLDHAVLIVGFNVHVSESGVRLPYWIIKNSWGEDWGDQGYYYLVRGRNACGIATDVSFPFVE